MEEGEGGESAERNVSTSGMSVVRTLSSSLLIWEMVLSSVRGVGIGVSESLDLDLDDCLDDGEVGACAPGGSAPPISAIVELGLMPYADTSWKRRVERER